MGIPLLPRADTAEIARHCLLTPPARELLRAHLTPPAYFRLLLKHGLAADGIRFLAQTLPPRLAVWWGCLCSWHMARPDPPESAGRALDAALQWVLDPSEENRQAAGRVGLPSQCETSAGCMAVAGFLSGGSLTLPPLPVVPPGPGLTGRVVGSAILLAAVERDVTRFREHYWQFLAIGLEVIQGKNLPVALPLRSPDLAKEGEEALAGPAAHDAYGQAWDGQEGIMVSS